MKRTVVIGGGVTGLAAAHRLLELSEGRGGDLEVTVLEASDRPGGAIATERRDGFVLELGPDSMITDKPWGLALARRLGLQEEVLGTQEMHRRSFVVRNGKLEPVPEGFQLLAPARFGPLVGTPIFSWPGKARMALDLVIPRREGDEDESLGHFVLRRLGREALERMAQPMIAGIYGADPMKLSLKATLPRFLDMERKHGSVIRGMWARSRAAAGGQGTITGPASGNGASPRTAGGPTANAQQGVSGARYGLFVSFRNGMQTLIDALLARLPAGCLRLNARVDALERNGEQWEIRLADGSAIAADAVVVALPAYRAAELVRTHSPRLAELLLGIPYGSAATLTLAFRAQDVPHPLNGFGFVVPAIEKLSLLGCTFTHRKFAHRVPEGSDIVLLRGFLGGETVERSSEEELVRRMRDDLRKLVGVSAEPRFVVAWRGIKVMPHYHVGHLERVEEMERLAAELPSFALAGNAYRGVGVPDSIHSGEQAAEAVYR